MTRWLIFCCLLYLAPPTRGAELLRPDQLERGMKGYGLSVFQGTEPERFNVEILGVLPNAFPKQDMILIRMSGANLEQHKVIAGMSGSPIYIEGKLIGALAYGWTFENEPLAGVTPIHNMLNELDRPAPEPKAVAATAPLPEPSARQNPLPGPRLGFEDLAGPRRMLTPLSLGGFSAHTIRLFAEQFEPFGLLPVAVGGSTKPARARPRGQIVPGGSIGVELVRGDLNAVGVGTATYVEGNRVLAFGHPMLQAGQLIAPAVQARVHTIMSSMARSFKIATAIADAGALVGDWQSCIVTDTKRTAPMIPVAVAVSNADTGHAEQYAMEIVDNEVLSPVLAQMAIAEAIQAASGASQETMVQIELAVDTGDRTVRLANTFFNARGGLYAPGAWTALTQIFTTPFGHTHIKSIDARVSAKQERRTALIKGAYFSKSAVDRGETVELTIVLKPHVGPEIAVKVPVEVPGATDRLKTLSVAVLAGAQAPADVGRPDSVASYLDALEKRHRHTDLVTLVRLPGQGLQYRGRLLKNLPPSALAVLDDRSNVDVAGAADVQQIVTPTDWVLSGQAFAQIPIREE